VSDDDTTAEREALERCFARIHDYVMQASSAHEPLAPPRTPEALARSVDLSLPEEAGGASALDDLVAEYLEHAVRTASPRFMNQLFSGMSGPGVVGELVAAVTNTSMYTWEVAPLATLIERALVARVAGMVGFVDGDGLFVTGGSNANLVAMLAARHRAAPELRARGLYAAPPLSAFVSEESHYSFETAAHVMGLGTDHLISIPVDDHGRMRPAALAEAIAQSRARGERPFFIGATAGTTVRGAFDPVSLLADIARREDLWLHVDAAFGGAALFSPTHAHLLEGVALADSFGWDAHKLMGLPLTCSLLLTKEQGHLEEMNRRRDTDYLFHTREERSWDLGRKSLQCGRRNDALKLFFAWKVLGDVGLAARVDHLMQLAAHAVARVADEPELELLSEAPFLNVCFRWRGATSVDEARLDALQETLREDLRQSGRWLVNHATVRGARCLRLVLANGEATVATVDAFFDDVVEASRRIVPDAEAAVG
jgi:glutamate/tyrosine decarboxylase-like PLP-dependent enzyme